MEYILENDKAKVIISSKAAEIHSFKKKSDNIEIMWQGDSTYWSGRNPILFPQVGNTYNKTQIFKGNEFHMGNHGFARHSEFELCSKSDSELVLVLNSDENTMKQYPYNFSLYVTYLLKETKLQINYLIMNKDDSIMPFGFGLHPAFNCPMENDNFEDYYIEFSSKENNNTKELKLIKDHKLALNRELFKEFPTVVYYNLNSAFVMLANGKNKIKVTCNGYEILAFWSPENAPFVCIEPWHSHGDFEKVDLPFNERYGIISLDSGKSYSTAYSIEIL